ncbi:hypothetical protein M5X11_29695 [Paenibacillus alginolyticus]|uniref:hypothetical protein n=1 Tax=Paenibacillus alginolyticus TaxID=59839 RepID=UPI0003F4B9EA|nr:hypothetical protein [Paenibacillus alginolyticus]MCY9669051.1 hypothetical protein [Paenibacillus alginolyticus]
MFTAIYVRVSTGVHANEGTSLSVQTEMCIKKARELNRDSDRIKVYTEEGEKE